MTPQPKRATAVIVASMTTPRSRATAPHARGFNSVETQARREESDDHRELGGVLEQRGVLDWFEPSDAAPGEKGRSHETDAEVDQACRECALPLVRKRPNRGEERNAQEQERERVRIAERETFRRGSEERGEVDRHLRSLAAPHAPEPSAPRSGGRQRIRASDDETYEEPIAELEAAREALNDEATLLGWLRAQAVSNAATDSLGDGQALTLPAEQ
jgi:hypothetical protein